MTEIRQATELINELLQNPERFDQEQINGISKGYCLLQHFFRGHAVETLRPLLKHNNPIVRRIAAFIAVEITISSAPLIEVVVPLIRDPDGYIAQDAIDCVFLCSAAGLEVHFLHIVRELESDRDRMNLVAMHLVSHANSRQLDAALQDTDRLGLSAPLHRQGLAVLLKEELSEEAILTMVANSNPLLRKYGAIAAKRHCERWPDSFSALMSSEDEDIRKFGTEALERVNNAVERRWLRVS